MYNGMHGGGWGGGQWIVAIAMMALFWAVIAALVIAVLHSGRGPRHDQYTTNRSSTDEAERILHERFARGEIDADEYTRRHDLLKERSR